MRISASEPVRIWLRALPPEGKTRVRRALKALARGGTRSLDIKPLRRELEGFHRLRVGDHRVLYHFGSGDLLRLDYADIRDVVYDAFRTLRGLREKG
jgi:mRNA-degrading endonuclease RelE of RelBE toxin-antitoxin system